MAQWNKDDLFYVCSMIEYVARQTHNKCKDIVAKLSDKASIESGISKSLSFF